MVLLAFGPLEFGLPGDTQQNVGSVKSSEVEFGFDLCGGYHRSEIFKELDFESLGSEVDLGYGLA